MEVLEQNNIIEIVKNKNLEHIELSKSMLDSKTAQNNLLNTLRNYDSQKENIIKQNFKKIKISVQKRQTAMPHFLRFHREMCEKAEILPNF